MKNTSSTLLLSLILLGIYNRQCCTNQPSRTIFISFSVWKWRKIQFSFLYCFSSFSCFTLGLPFVFLLMLDFPKKNSCQMERLFNILFCLAVHSLFYFTSCSRRRKYDESIFYRISFSYFQRDLLVVNLFFLQKWYIQPFNITRFLFPFFL